MENLMNRLETFLSWPDTILVSVSKLSECGLFYTGQSDTVECFHCHTRLSDWKQEHNPLERHLEVSPKCSVALKLKKVQHPNGRNLPNTKSNPETTFKRDDHQHGSANGNASVLLPNSSHQQQKDEGGTFASAIDFRQTEARTASFTHTWPSTCPVAVSDLVAAGLYYIGPGDRVQCAWCHGRLYNWEAGDIALGEHARHFPQCPFVRGEFANEPLETRVESESQGRGHVKDVTARKEPAAANIAEAMGFDKGIIEQAMQRFPESTTVTTSDLLDVLFDLEGRETNDEHAAGNHNHVGENLCSHNMGNKSETGNSQPKKEPSKLEDLIGENLTLRESQECVVCMEQDISVVFLPCRHRVCCNDCSMALKHCPLCRALIMGTIKAPDS